jgi:hypothetical protein
MRVLMAMKQQISWLEQDLKIHSQDLNQLAASQLELTRKRSGTGQIGIMKTLGIHYWTQTGKGIHIRTLSQT